MKENVIAACIYRRFQQERRSPRVPKRILRIDLIHCRKRRPAMLHDIASVLSHNACEPLDEEIEHLTSILASLAWRHRQREVRA